MANNAALMGVTLYGQPATLEPLANPLGLVVGNAVEVRIGDEFDPGSPTGNIVEFNPGGQPEYGAVAIRFEGLFF